MNANIKKWIDDNADGVIKVSDEVWEFAEKSWEEEKSAKAFAEYMRMQGFEVEMGVAGCPTAFSATWGSGKPKIAFLGEYDALESLGNEKVPYQKPIGDAGHGCGHNLLGAGAAAAAAALKYTMEQEGKTGTIVYFGCPAEEVVGAKVNMADAGLFADVDAAFTWHPGSANSVGMTSSQAVDSVKYNFHGKTAHAAGAPEKGRSALDAVEIMNVSVNYLREHVTDDVRIHYVVTNGGARPNIVPEFAQVWYFIRARHRNTVEEVTRRIGLCAQGAAMATETRCEIDYLAGSYDTVINFTLADVMYRAAQAVPLPKHTKEDLDFAAELSKELFGEVREKLIEDTFAPLAKEVTYAMGSTDVNDASYNMPTAQIRAATNLIGAPGHHWTTTVTSGTSLGHKGMLFAVGVLAESGYIILTEPDTVAKARAEFEESTKDKKWTRPSASI